MRGAVNRLVTVKPDLGIIPACAGSSRKDAPFLRGFRDHPRVCGEQTALYSGVPRSTGSSPRVRGAGRARPIAVREDGIIPACAGSSSDRSALLLCGWDHPRVCGEQTARSCANGRATGSSPRVRGAADVGVRMLSPVGIIPACAGSRRSIMASCVRGRDHPRVCGEQLPALHFCYSHEGSSPRVRGAVDYLLKRLRDSEIIPVCAGSSDGRGRVRRYRRDHPRVCGEQHQPAADSL